MPSDCAKSLLANVIAILLLGIVRHVPALPAPGPVWADAKPAPERFARLRRLSLALLLSALPVTGAGGAFLPRQGLGVFRHAWVSEKRSQTLNSLGEKHYG